MTAIRMEPLKIQLSLIKEMFPHQKEYIEELYAHNNDFRSLCDDYVSCILYLQKFQKEFSEKVEAIDEFENAKKLLQKELSEFLLKPGRSG